MSLQSIYSTGDDEAELFRLTAPETETNPKDQTTALQESDWLASCNYDDHQEESDERLDAHPIPQDLANALKSLSPEELATVIRFIQNFDPPPQPSISPKS